ncbi:TIGR03746 family integrating conjugative element protein [Psychromonas sp. B3M02]|uniref:PFL_4703 family integrating conjugative element protein n=1 Tax=Psychromonas sp. B3M02 TaxID=2267226 RepID=UPI000DEA8DBA|nr:TIGR03746 family integrating conjugative element protein [Psychromonas sp. B3M02]RBW47273.1 TIGR03746 family integrating conjugative element protein [Psychromonas sp. B3M02]
MSNFRFSNSLKSIGYINIFLLLIIMSLIALCFGLNRSIDIAKEEVLIRLEPDIRAGTTRKSWEVPPAFVYSFSLTITQKVNNWTSNGGTEYSQNILALQNYITPKCRRFLSNDLKNKKNQGQLQNRTRIVMESSGVSFSGSERTSIIDKGVWNTDLYLNITEYVNGDLVKDIDVLWPLRIVEFNIDSELNPQGLALDCFYSEPTLIKNNRI